MHCPQWSLMEWLITGPFHTNISQIWDSPIIQLTIHNFHIVFPLLNLLKATKAPLDCLGMVKKFLDSKNKTPELTNCGRSSSLLAALICLFLTKTEDKRPVVSIPKKKLSLKLHPSWKSNTPHLWNQQISIQL